MNNEKNIKRKKNTNTHKINENRTRRIIIRRRRNNKTK